MVPHLESDADTLVGLIYDCEVQGNLMHWLGCAVEALNQKGEYLTNQVMFSQVYMVGPQ